MLGARADGERTGCLLRETQAILRLFGIHRSHQAIFQWVHRVEEDALGRLREVEETDPNEEVRHAASVGIGEIESQ